MLREPRAQIIYGKWAERTEYDAAKRDDEYDAAMRNDEYDAAMRNDECQEKLY
jgi:hypothetical protein